MPLDKVTSMFPYKLSPCPPTLGTLLGSPHVGHSPRVARPPYSPSILQPPYLGFTSIILYLVFSSHSV